MLHLQNAKPYHQYNSPALDIGNWEFNVCVPLYEDIIFYDVSDRCMLSIGRIL